LKGWDLIVVGGGAVGSNVLRAAAESGARALGLEQFTPASTRGSSHGHSRIFRHAYFEHPEYVPLLRHSTARFESLEIESGEPLLQRCGMLVMGPPGSEIVRGSLESAERWSLDVERLDEPTIQRRFPWFDVQAGTIGAFEANAGVVRPEAAVNAALRVAESRGVELRNGTCVREVNEDATGVTVRTAQGSERASAVVIAAGAWAARLIPELGPLLRVTRQVQAWLAPASGPDPGDMPCWLYDRGPDRLAIYGLAPDPTARADGDRVPVPARHPKLGLHGSGETVDPDRGARPVDSSDVEHIRDALRACAPRLAGELVDAATCLYTMSPDGHFIVGTRPGSTRVHYAAGLSGHGFKLGPALGDALADLALLGHTRLPVGFLSPDRFATP
jgi:sarcosine oxidase